MKIIKTANYKKAEEMGFERINPGDPLNSGIEPLSSEGFLGNESEWIVIGKIFYEIDPTADTASQRAEQEPGQEAHGEDLMRKVQEIKQGTPMICEVCQRQKRGISSRRETTVVKNLQTGEVKTVGRECINSLIGGQ
jgi:hypothetical protein